jgi:hypothetical protein
MRLSQGESAAARADSDSALRKRRLHSRPSMIAEAQSRPPE